MTKYINREEIKKCTSVAIVTYSDGSKKSETVICLSQDDLYDLPTVDIVYCGECKHGRSYFVNRWACEHPQHKKQWHNTNWFCADGERKSDD